MSPMRAIDTRLLQDPNVSPIRENPPKKATPLRESTVAGEAPPRPIIADLNATDTKYQQYSPDMKLRIYKTRKEVFYAKTIVQRADTYLQQSTNATLMGGFSLALLAEIQNAGACETFQYGCAVLAATMALAANVVVVFVMMEYSFHMQTWLVALERDMVLYNMTDVHGDDEERKFIERRYEVQMTEECIKVILGICERISKAHSDTRRLRHAANFLVKAGFILFTLGTGFYLLQTRSTDDCPEDDEDTYFARIAGGLLGLTALVLGVLGVAWNRMLSSGSDNQVPASLPDFKATQSQVSSASTDECQIRLVGTVHTTRARPDFSAIRV